MPPPDVEFGTTEAVNDDLSCPFYPPPTILVEKFPPLSSVG